MPMRQRQPENNFECCFSFAETRFARFQAAFYGYD